VKANKRDLQTKEYRLDYISTGLQNTAQMNIFEAKKEVTKMSDITNKMFNKFLEVFHNPTKRIDKHISQVKEWEDLTDNMQEEISKYLVALSNEHLSEKNMTNVNLMMRIVHELENIGDSCYKLILLAQRRYKKKLKLHLKSNEEIKDYSVLIHEFSNLYSNRLNKKMREEDLKIAYELEEKINLSRNTLRKASRKRLQDGADVKAELLYLDILKNFEHIGDNILNISQALRQID